MRHQPRGDLLGGDGHRDGTRLIAGDRATGKETFEFGGVERLGKEPEGELPGPAAAEAMGQWDIRGEIESAYWRRRGRAARPKTITRLRRPAREDLPDALGCHEARAAVDRFPDCRDEPVASGGTGTPSSSIEFRLKLRQQLTFEWRGFAAVGRREAAEHRGCHVEDRPSAGNRGPVAGRRSAAREFPLRRSSSSRCSNRILVIRRVALINNVPVFFVALSINGLLFCA